MHKDHWLAHLQQILKIKYVLVICKEAHALLMRSAGSWLHSVVLPDTWQSHRPSIRGLALSPGRGLTEHTHVSPALQHLPTVQSDACLWHL